MKPISPKSLLLRNKTTKQTIAKNTFWLSLSNILGRLIKAALIVMAARVLGTEGYGIFSYALSASIIIISLVDLGLSTIVAREISYKESADHRKYISTALIVKIILIIFGSTFLAITLPLVSSIPEVISLIPLLILLIFFDGVREMIIGIAKGEEKMEHVAFIQLITTLSVTILGLIALLRLPDSKTLLISYVAGSAIGLLYALIWGKKYLYKFWAFFDKSIVKKMLSEAIPFAFLGLLGIIMINTDTLMIGWLEGATPVGLYAAAQKPIEVLYVIPMILATAMFPAMSRYAKTNNLIDSGRLLETMLKYSFIAAAPITIGGIILAKPIINLLYGSSYLASVIPFQILLMTILIAYPSVIIANAVFSFNKQSAFTKLLLFGTVANIIFNLLLIPIFSIVGSAIATILAQITANIFIWIKMKSIIQFKILDKMVKPIMAALIMTIGTIAMKYLGAHYLLNISISASIYIATLRLLKEPLLDIKEILRS